MTVPDGRVRRALFHDCSEVAALCADFCPGGGCHEGEFKPSKVAIARFPLSWGEAILARAVSGASLCPATLSHQIGEGRGEGACTFARLHPTPLWHLFFCVIALEGVSQASIPYPLRSIENPSVYPIPAQTWCMRCTKFRSRPDTLPGCERRLISHSAGSLGDGPGSAHDRSGVCPLAWR